MANIKQILISTLLLGIIAFSIMNFIIRTQIDNGLTTDERITNNSIINRTYSGLESNLSQQSSANDALDSLNEVPPQENIGDLSITSIISTTFLIRSLISGLWNVYILLPMSVLNVSPLVAGAITTILLISIGIGIWAIWKGAISDG